MRQDDHRGATPYRLRARERGVWRARRRRFAMRGAPRSLPRRWYCASSLSKRLLKKGLRVLARWTTVAVLSGIPAMMAANDDRSVVGWIATVALGLERTG
jgi:hypothetical protein